MTSSLREIEREKPGINNPANRLRGDELLRYDGALASKFALRQRQQDEAAEAVEADFPAKALTREYDAARRRGTPP